MSVESNKAVVRRIEEAWNASNLDALDAFFAPDFQTLSGVRGMPPTLESSKMAHQMSMQAFPDRNTSIEDIVAEGDNVTIRMRMTGTNTGGLPWFGVPANDKPIDVQWLSIYRLKDGKVVQHQAVMDLLGLMQQLGAIPSQS